MDPMMTFFLSRPMALNRQNPGGVYEIFKAMFCCGNGAVRPEGEIMLSEEEEEENKQISLIEPDMVFYQEHKSMAHRVSRFISAKNIFAISCLIMLMIYLAVGTGTYYGNVNRNTEGEEFLEDEMDNVIMEEINGDDTKEKMLYKTLSDSGEQLTGFGNYITAGGSLASFLDSIGYAKYTLNTEEDSNVVMLEITNLHFQEEVANDTELNGEVREKRNSEEYTGNNTEIFFEEQLGQFNDSNDNMGEETNDGTQPNTGETENGENNPNGSSENGKRKRGNLNDKEYATYEIEEMGKEDLSNPSDINDNLFRKKRFIDFQKKYQYLIPNYVQGRNQA